MFAKSCESQVAPGALRPRGIFAVLSYLCPKQAAALRKQIAKPLLCKNAALELKLMENEEKAKALEAERILLRLELAASKTEHLALQVKIMQPNVDADTRSTGFV